MLTRAHTTAASARRAASESSFDRAPPTSSYVRRSRRRAPRRLLGRRASCRPTPPRPPRLLLLAVVAFAHLSPTKRQGRAHAKPRARHSSVAGHTTVCQPTRPSADVSGWLLRITQHDEVVRVRIARPAIRYRASSTGADPGDAERAPSRERVVVSAERLRPRRASAGRTADARVRHVVCAAVRRVTSPRLLLSSSHRRLGSIRSDTGDAERAPSRERVVAPTERRRPHRACAGRTADARVRRRVRRRASSDITAPPALLVASPARLCQSRRRRRRASAEPPASRRADRAPPASSCVRRAFR